MMFRVVKDALVTLLGDNAEERFQVVGYRRQNKNATQIKDHLRMVQVYYTDGSFPKTGRMRGAKTHDLTLDIDLSCSAAAQGDLSVLDNPASSPLSKAIALASVKEASERADLSMDELIEAVYQILMDARNEKLGLLTGEVSSRWIDAINKNTVLENGDLVVKTANMKYTCRVQEEVLGDSGTVQDETIFNSDNLINGNAGSGVNVTNKN